MNSLRAHAQNSHLNFFQKLAENLKKWRKHVILKIIKSSHIHYIYIMKSKDVIHKLHVSIIQDHLSNLICVQKSFWFLLQQKHHFWTFSKKLLENKNFWAEFLSYLRTKSVQIWFQKWMQDTMQTVSIGRYEFLRKCASMQPALHLCEENSIKKSRKCKNNKIYYIFPLKGDSNLKNASQGTDFAFCCPELMIWLWPSGLVEKLPTGTMWPDLFWP